jgi:hypothetical protein
MSVDTGIRQGGQLGRAVPGGYRSRTLIDLPIPGLRSREDGNWAVQGICNQTDPDLWFADHASTAATTAKRICREECPVQRQCLNEGLHPINLEWGIYGGYNASERRRMVGKSH